MGLIDVNVFQYLTNAMIVSWKSLCYYTNSKLKI